MESANDHINVGQFVLETNHIIVAWDEGLEKLTGLKASEMVGTSDQWRAYHSSPRPVLADYFLDGDFEGACVQYGTDTVWLLEESREWLAVGQCLDAKGHIHAILAKASWHPDSGGVVQSVYLIEHITSWARVSSDRFDGMRVLAENVPAGVTLIQDGRMVFVNQTMCTMFGYKNPAELIDRPSADMLVEEQRGRHIQLIQTLTKENAGARYEWTGIDKNGRKLWFEGRPMPIEWNGRPAVLSFVMDITEFKHREELMAQESHELRLENVRLKSSIDTRIRLGNIIGRSLKMQEVFDSILRAAASDSGVIIYGETGTGKELVAKAIHSLSERTACSFVPVNCGAIPEELFESEFFGYRKGAFTGANADKAGLLDKAKGGCLFLDEIGELSPNSQAKLLRALGSGEYTAVGDSVPRQADFRIIAATNKNLEDMVRRGTFRQDLFYRVHILPIYLPPVRERKEDIPFLVEHILRKMNAQGSMPSKDLTCLMEHDWPGNVRELQNVLERYVAFGNLDFLNIATQGCSGGRGRLIDSDGLNLRDALDMYEREIILHALKRHEGNRSHAAAALGLPRKTLFRKMKKLAID